MMKNWKKKVSMLFAFMVALMPFSACDMTQGSEGLESSNVSDTLEVEEERPTDDDYNVYAYYFPNSGTQNVDKPWSDSWVVPNAPLIFCKIFSFIVVMFSGFSACSYQKKEPTSIAGKSAHRLCFSI